MIGPATINIVSIVSVLSTLVPKAVSLTPELKDMTAAEVLKLGSNNTTSGGSTATSDPDAKEEKGIVQFLQDLGESEITYSLDQATAVEKNEAIEMAKTFIKLAEA